MGFEAGWSGGWPGLLSRPLGDTTKGNFTRWPELSLVHRRLPVNSVCRPGRAEWGLGQHDGSKSIGLLWQQVLHWLKAGAWGGQRQTSLCIRRRPDTLGLACGAMVLPKKWEKPRMRVPSPVAHGSGPLSAPSDARYWMGTQPSSLTSLRRSLTESKWKWAVRNKMHSTCFWGEVGNQSWKEHCSFKDK